MTRKDSNDRSRIIISTGEASGDLHGAGLISAIKKLAPDIDVCGMGGKALQEQGVELLYNVSSLAVTGFIEVFSHLSDIRAAKNGMEQRLKEWRPHLLILIDYPDFNLMLAKKAKQLGIPVLYYISPQVWAWRSGRVKKINRLVDRMAVILPFEQEFYRQKHMEVDFVGHPLLDSVKLACSKKEFLKRHGIPGNGTRVGILPGSRKKEISSILPVFLESAKKLYEQRKDLVFLLPLASTLTREDLEENGLNNYGLDIKVVSENRYDLMAACDAVMAASGTVTLELAILNIPMVVSYRTSPLTYFLGRRLIKVQFASLVNLVAGKEVVEELLQDDARPDRIAAAVMRILKDKERSSLMREQLAHVCKQLGKPGASDRTAQLAIQLINQTQI